MSCIVKHHEGPVDIAAAGAYDFYYKHPEGKPPAMIDLISGELLTGTGCAAILYYIDGSGVFHRIDKQQLTNNYPIFTYNQAFILVSGEAIKLRFYNPAAADQVQWTVNGH